MYRARTVHSGGKGQGFIAEIDQAEGWYFASGGTYHQTTFLRSPDGERWETTKVPQTSGLRGLVARAADDVIVVGEYGLIATTRDRGDSWEVADTPVNHCLYRILDALGALWAVCDSGVLRSDDEGSTWDRVHNSARMLKCELAQGRLFFFGDGMYAYDGASFSEVHVSREAPLTGLIEIDGTLVLIGDGGQIFRSDEGTRWSRVRCPSDADLEDIVAVPGGVVAVGSGGTLLFSEDGERWERIDVGLRDHLWSALAVSDDLLVGCPDGKILRFERNRGSDDDAWEDLD